MLTGGSVAITPWVLFPVLIACEQPDQFSGTTIPSLMAKSNGGRYPSLLCGRSELYFRTYNLTNALAWST